MNEYLVTKKGLRLLMKPIEISSIKTTLLFFNIIKKLDFSFNLLVIIAFYLIIYYLYRNISNCNNLVNLNSDEAAFNGHS